MPRIIFNADAGVGGVLAVLRSPLGKLIPALVRYARRSRWFR
jgi:hypothetical protein